MADLTRKALSNAALVKGLESLLYEMVILSSALLLRDKRYFFKDYPGLPWGAPQIAHDVIRLKSRLLFDFFYADHPDRNDIVAYDFRINVPAINSDALQRLKQFKQRVNKWTIHLTRTRTIDPEYSKRERQLMEQYALELLNVASKFIEQCLANGFKLDGWAKLYHDNFQRLHAYLVQTPRVEEGKGIRPTSQISLENLSIKA